ncbi:MAG TPA: hypothetical protein VF137_09320 [Candidatus Dormibacteraeota bacterium]
MRRACQLLVIGLAGSQAGHFLSYEARFGAGAGQLQSSGVHAYYLPLATALAGGVGSVLLVGLLLVAWARVFSAGGRVRHATGSWRVFDAFAALFVLQLTVYAGQESVESLAGGLRQPLLLDLLLWGSLGQLPVALLGAIALTWWSTAVGGAVAAIEVGLVEVRPVRLVLSASPARPDGRSRALILQQCAPASFAKRGPPLFS